MFHPAAAYGSRFEEFSRNSMFSVVNATFGTGIASTDAPTTYAVTTPLMHFYNSNATYTRWMMLDQLFLRVTAVNTSATSFHLQFVKRSGNTYTSGGTELSPVNIGATAVTAAATQNALSVATVYFGVLVASAAAATTDRIVWRQQVRDVIFAADDTVELLFGEGQTGTHGATTSATSKMVRIPPMWIAPGESLQIHAIAPSQAADPAFEVSCSWMEGPSIVAV
jgi:hypothetical protein